MNPELLRNIWLEASPFRLMLIAGLLVLVFAAGSVAPAGLMTTHGTAQGLYWFFAVLWGTRSAALSVVAEIRERTWDGQKLSSIGPWSMVWGKLFGATAANWFGALVCLPFILAPMVRDSGVGAALLHGVILVSLGVFAQGVALLSSLALIRRQTGNWRLDTFLCQVAGIGAAFGYYSLWNAIGTFERTGTDSIVWWGHAFGLGGFHLASLLLLLVWVLVGCWRAMRAELRFANGPFVWLAYLAYAATYTAGFSDALLQSRAQINVPAGSVPLALAGLTLLALTYGMAFLEPKDPVRLRWLGEQVRAGRLYAAFLALDCWMLSYGAALVVGLVLAASWAALAPPLALGVLAVLGFLTRDICIFVLGRIFAGAKGDFAALAILAVLYFVLPTLLWRANASFLLVPSEHAASVWSVMAAWAQGLGLCLWVAHTIRDRSPR